MKRALTVVTLSTAMYGGALAFSGPAAAVDVRQVTDHYLFEVSMKTFLAARADQPYPDQLTWSSDGCSASPDKPRGYNFLPPCQRHDFGYRNYKRQDRFSEDNRKRIDDKFKRDMYDHCDTYSGWDSWKGVECRRYADAYYAAVRQFGNLRVNAAERVDARR